MKDKLRKVILWVCVCVFVYSAVQLGMIFYDYYMIEKETSDIIDEYVDESTDDIDPLHRVVNFTELQETNKDVIGWLYIPNTKIDEPILKGETNDTYLRTDIYKKSNKAGCIFIDEINNGDFKDDNTIIYGHNMKNGSRFHDLKQFVDADFFKENRYVYIYLPDQTVNVYDIYGADVISAYSELYRKGIDYQKYVKEVLKDCDQKTEVSEEEAPLIMLSTCYTGTDDRYVTFARLKENLKID